MATRRTAAARTTSSKPTAPTRLTRATASRTPSALEPPVVQSTATKSKTRKPLVNRNNSEIPPAPKSTKAKGAQKKVLDDNDREPLKAFLRIRPNLGDTDESSSPYLEALSATSVKMTDPAGMNRIRLHPQAQIYTFNHVFPPETQQEEFFSDSTLPLVRELLAGQNGLIFAYGVTNSGKTYTIQGGSQPGTAGILPRTMDVLFNSLEGLQSNLPYRPVRLAGIEHASQDEQQSAPLEIPDDKMLSELLGEAFLQKEDSTTIKVDKNYEYAVWISYAEVYNEKVYDLLSDNSSDNNPTPNARGKFGLPRSAALKSITRSSTWQSLTSLASSSSADVLLVKRKALTLKSDPETGGKYVAGLKSVCVRSAEEAKRIFRMGNLNRRVFGTMANAASSRSHGIFTLKVVRIHKGDHSDVSVSRLSIVDLAGSERMKNTKTAGDRLKEAGSINKSLMVLGQCMEALRSNQKRLAASLAAPGRGILGPGTNMKLAIVPFRHSKLTELFQDFFVGEREGRAVMIVNVNPYDTGFDENAHVMRFAALAREVTTAPAATPIRAVVKNAPPPPTPRESEVVPHRRQVVLSTGGRGGKKFSEAHLEIVEEDEEPDEDNNEPTDLLVEALFDEIEQLREKLFDSEMRCAIIEAETREEVMQEMEVRMMKMERMFSKRMMHTVEQNEAMTDAKIDMLHQFGAFGSKTQSAATSDADVESNASGLLDNSFVSMSEKSVANEDEDEGESTEEVSDCSTEELNISDQDSSTHSSPLQHKTRLSKAEKKKLQSGPQCIGLREEDMTIDEIDADETMTNGGIDDDEEEDDEGPVLVNDVADDTSQGNYGDDSDSDEEEWAPSEDSSPAVSGAYRSKPARKVKAGPSTANKTPRGVSSIQQKMNILSISDSDYDDSDMSVQEVKGRRRQKSSASEVKSAGTRRSTRSSKR